MFQESLLCIYHSWLCGEYLRASSLAFNFHHLVILRVFVRIVKVRLSPHRHLFLAFRPRANSQRSQSMTWHLSWGSLAVLLSTRYHGGVDFHRLLAALFYDHCYSCLCGTLSGPVCIVGSDGDTSRVENSPSHVKVRALALALINSTRHAQTYSA